MFRSLFLSFAFLLPTCAVAQQRAASELSGTWAEERFSGDRPDIDIKRCGVDESILRSPDILATDRGAIQGAVSGATWSFKGIPFAEPPVGRLRWRPPKRARCWSGVRPATAFANQCAQLGGITGSTQTWLGSEDCLYLNVWTPIDRRPNEELPVLFYLHGGGNTRGASNFLTFGATIYDGQSLAEKHRVVVVTTNYRLHYLGSLAHASLTAESHQGTSGNYGALDQIEALRWVRRNIRKVGGDPQRVLVFGQSAGAADACVLAASPLARRVLSRVGMISGQCENIPTLARMETSGGAYVANLGCATAADIPECLRSKPLAEVVLAAVREPLVPGGFQLGPNIDGWLLTEQPIDAIRSGRTVVSDWLISSAADEVRNALLPAFWAAPVNDVADYQNAIRTIFGVDVANGVLMMYPATDYESPRDALIRVLTDSFLTCPSRRMARAVAASGRRAYRAFYSHTYSNGPIAPLRAGHITDMPFWFQNLALLPGFAPTASESSLAAAMGGYLTSFASTGDPNHGAGTLWPAYDAYADSYLLLNDEIQGRSGVRPQYCDFWDAHQK